MAGDGELRLHARWQGVLAEMADAPDFCERDPGFPRRPVADCAARKVERRRVGLADRAGEFEDVLPQALRRAPDRLAADCQPARRPGATAIGGERSIAAHHADILRRNPQAVGDDLGERAQSALPELYDGGDAADLARRFEPHRRAVLGADAGASRAVALCADGGHFQECSDPDPAIDPVSAQRGLFGAQRVVAHRGDQFVEALPEAQPAHGDSAGCPERKSVLGPVIAPAHLHRIDAGGMGRPVDKLLGHRAGDRLADRAVHAGRRLVLEGDAQPAFIVFVGVGPAGQRNRHHAFIDRHTTIGSVGAEGGKRIHREAPDTAVSAHAQLRGHRLVAGLDVADEGFHAVGGIFYRPAQNPADGRDRDLLAIDVQLDAEPAADIGRHDTDEMLGNAEMARQRVLLVPRRLVAAVDGEAAFPRIVVGNHGSGFQRHARVAGKGEAALHDMLGPGECGIRIAGPDRGGEAEISAQPGMSQCGVFVERAVANGRRRQRLPLDDDFGSGVFGQGTAGGDDRRNGFALPDRAVHRDGMLRRRDQRRQMVHPSLPGSADRRNVGPGEHLRVRHRGKRRRRIDRQDSRMRIRAPDERKVEQARKAEVAGIFAAAEYEPPRGAARQGPADHSRPAIGKARCRHSPPSIPLCVDAL